MTEEEKKIDKRILKHSVDPRICYIGELGSKDEPNLEEQKEKQGHLVGFFLPVLGGKDLVETMLLSLVESLPLNYTFGLVALDGGSEDGTLELLIEGNIITYSNASFHSARVSYREPDSFRFINDDNITGLVKPPTENVGCKKLLGDYNRESKSFPNELGFTHISYLHSDMKYPEFDWVQKLCDHFGKYPNIGIFGPRTEQCSYEEQYWTDDMIEASVAPFFITLECLVDHYDRVGGLIDPELFFQVGYCDWDMHLRNYKLGYESKVWRHVFVDHPMCGTRPELDRKDPNRRKAFHTNQAYWSKKWGRHATQDPMGCIRKGLIKADVKQ